MFNKPRGYLTARRDANRPTIMELLGEEIRSSLHPVGRLDMDTEGFLILTDDGALDQRLLPPERQIPKRYYFCAFGEVSPEYAARIETGIELFGNLKPALPAKLELLGKGAVRDYADLLPELRRNKYLRNPGGVVTSGLITVVEGKKHEVKLILKSAVCHVFYLKRLSIGGVGLDESLGPGEYRDLTPSELERLTDKRGI